MRSVRSRISVVNWVVLVSFFIFPFVSGPLWRVDGQGGTGRPTAPTRNAKKTPGKTTESKVIVPKTDQTKTATKIPPIPAFTITTIQSLRSYDSFEKGDLSTIVIPNMNTNAISISNGSVPLKNGARGRDFEDLRIEQRGNDAVLSFRLQPGAYARMNRRVRSKLENLDVFIFLSKPDNTTSRSEANAKRTAKDISGASATRPVSDAVNSNRLGPGSNLPERNLTGSDNSNSNVGPTLRPPPPGMADPNEGSKTVPLRIDKWPSIGSRIEPESKFDAALLIPVSGTAEGRPPQVVYTKGEFSELSGKRRVIVNADSAATADKLTARLREYSGLEIVKTAREAEFALNVNSWTGGTLTFMGIPTKTFKGGSLIVTVRDTSLPIPRIIWRHTEDGDGGAFDKLAKRFIRDLKKLRGEK